MLNFAIPPTSVTFHTPGTYIMNLGKSDNQVCYFNHCFPWETFQSLFFDQVKSRSFIQVDVYLRREFFLVVQVRFLLVGPYEAGKYFPRGLKCIQFFIVFRTSRVILPERRNLIVNFSNFLQFSIAKSRYWRHL